MRRLACLCLFSQLAASAVTAQDASTAIRPFKIRVPDAVLRDLKERLARTRFPDEIEGAGWDYGADLRYMKELVAYWRTKYDWRKHEAELNRFAQFTTNIDGLDVHFIHQRSKHANALPLISLQGFPSSISEFVKIIGPLTEPERHGGRAEDAFHFVTFSLPGIGFTERPTTPLGRATRRSRPSSWLVSATRGMPCRAATREPASVVRSRWMMPATSWGCT